MCGRWTLISLIFGGFSILFYSCQAEQPREQEGIDEKTIEVKINASFPGTKTLLSDEGSFSSFSFEIGDKIGFFASDILTNCELICNNGLTGSFQGVIKLDDQKAQYRPSIEYYAYYPYDSNGGSDASDLHCTLPYIQSAPFDGNADYLVASPLTDVYDVGNFPELDFTFSTHLFSIVKLSITNTCDEWEEEQVLEIGLRSSVKNLTGSFTIDARNPLNSPVFSSDPNLLHKSVSVRYSPTEGPLLGVNNTHTVYAVVKPGVFEAGELELVVSTTNHLFTLSTKNQLTLTREYLKIMPTVDLADAKVAEQNDPKLFTSFSLSDGINEYPAFDISKGVISIIVPNQAIIDQLSATFTHTGSYVSVDGIGVTDGSQKLDYSDFLNPQYFSVHSAAGSIQTYKVMIFDLPVVYVTTPAPIVDKVTWIENCSVSIYTADGAVTNYGNKVQMRGRGNSTWDRCPKKPYTIKLKDDASVLGMPPEKRWNLMANFFDRTHLRNDICLEIAHRAKNFGWSSHGKFVELFMNGEFVGTYYLCEHTKVGSNRVNITKMSKEDNSGTAITGGYLLEFDSNLDDDPHFTSSIFKYYVKVKSPDDVGFDAQWAWIKDYINHYETILSNPDSLAAHKYLDYMDVDSFVDWYLIHEIAGQTEAIIPASNYMYKDRGGKLHAGPAWDFDKVSFKVGMGGWIIKDKFYYKALFKDSYFVNKVKERWPSFVNDLDGMEDYIDQQIKMVIKAAERDKKMWPPTNENQNGDNGFTVAAACERLKATYIGRIAGLTTLINNLVANPTDRSTDNENYGEQTTPDFGFGF